MKGVVLTLDTHELQLVNTITELLKNNTLTDVTLVGDDRIRIEAHKIVLCAGSSMFRDFFLNNAHPHPMIYLKGMKQTDLKSVLEYLYYGETTISQQILNDFLKTAKDLEICGLDTEIEDHSEEDIDNDPQNPQIDEESFQQTLFECSKCDQLKLWPSIHQLHTH